MRLHAIAANVLQPCHHTQGSMVTLELNTGDDKREITIDTPTGFSCPNNTCNVTANNATVVGPCEIEYLVTVKAINCSNSTSFGEYVCCMM